MDIAASAIRTRAEQLTRTLSGTIRVTATAAAHDYWVLPIIAQFRRNNPTVMFEASSSEHQVSLEQGEADIALRATETVVGDTLIARRLYGNYFAVYCSQYYDDTYGAPCTLADVKDHPFLGYPKQLVQKIAALRWVDSFLNQQKNIGLVDSVPAMASSLRVEDAIGMLPRVVGDNTDGLKFCFSHQEFESPLWLVASKEAYQDPMVRTFMKFFAEHFPKDGGPVSVRH